MNVEQKLLDETYTQLTDMIDRLEGLEEWAQEQGYTAIAHKIEETWGPLNSAAAATRQYRDGELTRRDL